MSRSTNINYAQGVFWVAVAAILWSTGGALIKFAEIDSLQVTFWRSLFALIVMVWLVRPHKISLEPANLIAGVAYALTLLFFVIGTKLTTAANAIFLQYTAPLYIVGISYVFFREKFRRGEMLALFFCIVGILFFFSDQVDLTGYIGMLWSLASGVSYAIFIVFSKRRYQGHYAEPAMLGAFFSMILSAFLILLEHGSESFYGFSLSGKDFLTMFFLGVFQIGVACYLYMKGLRAVSSLEAGVITMLEPIFNPVWAFFLISEIPSINSLIGGAVVLLAIFIHTLQTYSSNRKKNILSKF